MKTTPADHGTDWLRYRRQFVIGPRPRLGSPPGWKQVAIHGDLWAAAHPDLEVCQVSDRGRTFTLLGYALDPAAPAATNAEVLTGVMGRCRAIGDVPTQVADLGGRWVLCASDGEDGLLLHDAAGFREVYYAVSDSLWCASETGLLAAALNLGVDEEAEAFTRFKDARVWGVYWWPGDTSMYRGVRALLPNHSLNLGTGVVRRYWPRGPIPRVSVEEAVETCARTFRGLVQSARTRYGLALSCTAGWDSRLMLAMSRQVAGDLYFFTVAYEHYTRRTPDLRIPKVLLKKLGLVLDVIPCSRERSAEFEGVFRASFPSIEPEGSADIEALYRVYPDDRVCITGDAAEITKCYYWSQAASSSGLDARTLTELAGLGAHPFALRAFERWRSEVGTSDVDLRDLFCWEHQVGRWQARKSAAYDLVYESVTPYNCRSLLETMLGVDDRHRRPPGYEFHRKLIAALWEDVLSEPINPVEWSLRGFVKRWLVRMHLRG